VTRILSKLELEGLETLPIRIPDYEGSHPFSSGISIEAYGLEELKKKSVTKQARTDWFEKRLFAIWREIGKPVPYAFRTADGTIRSMDAGCLGFLFNRTQPELVAQTDPNTGEIVAVEPAGQFKTRYERLEASLRGEVRPETPMRSEPTQGGTIKDSAPVYTEGLALELGFNLDDPPDERRRELSRYVIREGAAAFRNEQMKLWAAQCAATGCNIREALDAAHIFRYLGEHTNRPDNGILLRADIHKLFDRNLIALEEREGQLIWRVSATLMGSDYATLEGRRVALGSEVSAVPHPELLARHLKGLQP
jgi:HNH endonuclease